MAKSVDKALSNKQGPKQKLLPEFPYCGGKCKCRPWSCWTRHNKVEMLLNYLPTDGRTAFSTSGRTGSGSVTASEPYWGTRLPYKFQFFHIDLLDPDTRANSRCAGKQICSSVQIIRRSAGSQPAVEVNWLRDCLGILVIKSKRLEN
jgi:hypothetical protein